MQILPRISHSFFLGAAGSMLFAAIPPPPSARAARNPAPHLRAAFYVAPNGNDAWSGTLARPNPGKTDGPFATLSRARDALRAARKAGKLPPAASMIQVLPGEYRLTAPLLLGPEDSGTAAAPTRIEAARYGTVRITGGIRLPPSAFHPLRDPAIRKRLPAAVRDRVLAADLAALGIRRKDLGRFPVRFRGAPDVPELFFNDRRMPLARWPNQGWATIRKILDSGSIPRTGDKGKRGGTFEYSGDQPRRWNVQTGVWLRGYWCYDWFSEAIRVGAIDPGAHRITLAAPTVYGIRHGNPSPRRWRAFNLLEELDSPGEYYIDRANGILYFLPPEPLQPNSRIVLSLLDAPLLKIQGARNLDVRGFIFEATRQTAVEIQDCRHVRLQACEIRNTRTLGAAVQGGARNTLQACDIHDTGTGGVVLRGGDRRTLAPARHQVLNCHIWRFSQLQLTYANAILLAGVGNRAAHNLIHDAPHQAIGVSGNDHIFEYNIVHDVCMATDDCGAYYKGRNPSCRGNIIRWNFWYHIGSPMGHGNAAIYFDDGDGGDTVYGNVFFRCGEPGRGSFGTVFSHGGFGILAENNIFIDCKRALGSAPWNFKRWNATLHSPLFRKRLLEEVDITKPPYTTHYPELAGFMHPTPSTPRVSRARRNLFVMCGDIACGNWQVPQAENWVTQQDPGFVDAAHGDFRLKPDSQVFRRLPGFRAIPFDKIGLTAGPFRPHPERIHWTFGPPVPLPPLPRKQRAKSRYAPPPLSGPRPVFAAPRARRTITVDGRLAPEEWAPGHGAPRPVPVNRNVDGKPVPQNRSSLVWLAWTPAGLYVAADNHLDPRTPLAGHQWGRDPAVELAFKAPKQRAIRVVRGYPDGTLRFGTVRNPAAAPRMHRTRTLRFAAKILGPGHWTAEFFLPFSRLGFLPGKDPRIAFNLTVREPKGDLWIMLAPNQAHSYDVLRAAALRFTP